MIKPWKEKHREENKYLVGIYYPQKGGWGKAFKKILESCGIWPFGVGKRNREKFSRGGEKKSNPSRNIDPCYKKKQT